MALTSPRRDVPLARKLLRPLVTACLAFAAAGYAMAAYDVLDEERTRLGEKAADVAMTVGVVSEHVGSSGDLQRMVAALASDRAVRLVVVAAGSEPRVMASSRFAWVGSPVTDVEPELGRAFLGALGGAKADAWVGDAYRHVRVVRFTLPDVASRTPVPGAVLVELDAGSAYSRAARSLALLFATTAAATLALLFALARLLQRHILTPLARVAGDLRAPEAAQRGVSRDESWSSELSLVTSALNQALASAHDRALELEASEARLRELLESLPEHVFTATPAGDLDFVSATMEAYFGVSAEEFVQRGWPSFIHPDDVNQALSGQRAAVEAGTPSRIEFRLRRADGEYRWHLSRVHPLRDASGAVSKWLGTNLDITERKLVEHETARARDAALLAAANRQAFEAIFEQSPDALLLTDDGSRVQACNARALDLFGPAVGITLGELIPGADTMISSLVGTSAQGPASTRLRSFEARGRKGPFAAEVSAAATPGMGTRAAIVAVRDLTERRRMEEALTASLHEKETLLREVHHRVKNNLQIVSSLLTMQAQGAEGGVRGALEDAVTRVRSMAYVHQQLYGTDHFSSVDLGDYARTLARSLVTSPDVRLAFDLDAVEVPIDVAIPCGLLLNELLTNALKHGRSADGTCSVTVRVRSEGALFVLAVSDEGPGLPPGAAEGRSGSLGMQLVRTLTRQVRGRVEMNSQGGASVSLRIPFEQARPSRAPTEASSKLPAG